MKIPSTWTPEIWRRATTPTIPAVIEADGHLVSEATDHHADYVGQDRWVVDYLPGRQLSVQQAKAAMRIAVAPELAEVERWATQLGLTAAEARGFAAMPVGVHA
ncbi:hypothetical protein [Nocardia cyriacigeorgica]|uniref:Uncharacterized protein n=1 Tax=Nocardia cyriacigeorgica TaxID=135487 RepID=A0A6P1DB77_9NOCA|nr:hypothetical protein [Nocardia cyriacigeorgica]NEW42523.1 hypothetical protein [Nocardia cyriacigeorgica]NEW47976.1 hypothetical protein [Nocardia cyriacigeorgica]